MEGENPVLDNKSTNWIKFVHNMENGTRVSLRTKEEPDQNEKLNTNIQLGNTGKYRVN